MVERGQRVSVFEARLAEMDRRLGEMQAELAPQRQPRARRATPAVQRSHIDQERPRGRSGPLASVLERSPRAEQDPDPARSDEPPPAPAPPPPPRAAPPPSPAAPPPAGQPQAVQLEAMAALCSRLVASMRELLDGYEAVLERTSASTAQAAPTAPREVALTAGPFRDLGALRGFEEAVSNLPGVRDVAVRGYEGNDRAILDVRLIG